MAEEPSEDDREDAVDGEPHDPFADDTDPDGGPSIENPFPADDPAADAPAADSSDGDTVEEGVDRDSDAPLDGLAREVSRRRRRADDDPDPDPDADPFEEVDVGDLDEEELWASLSGEGSGAGTDTPRGSSADVSTGSASAVADPGPVPVDGADAGDVGDARPEHVLDKRTHCQRCPYLSAPPDVACGHDGTDILEVVDAERFRVRGCPMVTDEGRPAFSTAGEAERIEASMGSGEGSDPRMGEVDAVDGDGPVADDFDT